MIHHYSITCPSYLCAPDDRVGLDGIAGLFQEAAWQHARRLGVAFTEAESPVFWALHRLGLRIHRRPVWGERITITTWPSRIERLFAMREYTIHSGNGENDGDRPSRDDNSGELLVEGSSSWLVLRTRDSRPEPPARHFPEGDLQGEYAIEMPLGRLPTIGDDEAAPLLTGVRWHPVRPSDTDRNAHVNNTRYAQWFTDEVPELFKRALENGAGSDPPLLLLSFTAETRIGQEYAVISHITSSIAEIRVRDPDQTPGEARCACRLQLV